MEESLILLSSMSPCINRTVKKQNCKKGPTKLALKRNFRRSSVFDKHAENALLHLASGSSSETASTDSSKCQSLPKVVGPTIIISDSDESNIIHKTPDKKKKEQAEDDKTDLIERWIKGVNKATENEDTVFTEVSAIVNSGFGTVSGTDGGAVNSTAVEGNNKRFDELFKTKNNEGNIEESSGLYKSCISNSVKEDTGKSDESEDDESVISNSYSEESNEGVTSILDKLYGNKWREKKHLVLPKSEPRNRKQKTVYPTLPATEIKPKNSLLYKNPYLRDGSPEPSNILKPPHIASLQGPTDSPWKIKLANLCDSDTASEDSDPCRRKLNFDDDDSEKENKRQPKLNTDKRKNETNSPSLQRLLDKIQNEPARNFNSVAETKKTPRNLNCLDAKPKKASETAGTGKIKSQRKKDKQVAASGCSDTEEVEKRLEDLSLKDMRSSYLKNKEVTYSFLASLSANIPIPHADPSALIYRNNFKACRDKLLQRLFKLYNDTIFDNCIPQDTPFEWSTRMRGSAGFCFSKRKVQNGIVIGRSVRIALSTKVVDTADRLRDTLVHELCHAATWLVNHVIDGHGEHWRAWADKAMRTYPELPPIRRCHDYDITYKYTYKCVGCSYSIGRHTKSIDIERKRCGYCYGRFEILLNKTDRKGAVKKVPASAKKEATGFALFVKENYAKFKTPERKHGDVMKMLGEKYKEVKDSNKKIL